jgi:hypothetical protein
MDACIASGKTLDRIYKMFQDEQIFILLILKHLVNPVHT